METQLVNRYAANMHGAECVNDFATPGVINLLCSVV